MLFPEVRNSLIGLMEAILHRSIDAETWNIRLLSASLGGLGISVVLFFAGSRYFPVFWESIERRCPPFYAIVTIFAVLFTGLTLLLASVSQAVWLDETCSLAPIQGSWSELMTCLRLDSHPPLFFSIEKCWALLWGDGVFVMKSFSIIPTVLTMVLTAVFLKKEFSGKAAVLLLPVFFASENIIHYSIEIRMYTWAFFFVTMAAICAWYLITTRKTMWAVLFLLSAEAAAYTHYYAAIAVGIEYMFLLLYTLRYDRANTMKMVVIAIVAITLYLPWLGVAVKSFSSFSKDFWIPPLTVMDIVDYVKFVFYAGILSPILFAAFFVIFCNFLIKKCKHRIEWFAFSGLSCLFILVLAGIVLSLLTRPLLADRYLFPACGLVWLFFAIEGATIRSKRLFFFLFGLLISIGGAISLSSFLEEKKEAHEFHRFHSYLSERIGEDDIFIISPNEKHMPGISAFLFRGHAYVHECKGVWKEIVPLYGRMFGSPCFSYRSLSDEKMFGGRRAWIIVSERTDNLPNTYQIPEEAQAQWCGSFGWKFYKFDLYVSENPAAFAR
jgi:hypothetical protein